MDGETSHQDISTRATPNQSTFGHSFSDPFGHAQEDHSIKTGKSLEEYPGDILNSPLFLKSNPLPLEILEMPQEETACKYCGISYLLLTKYEKMSHELEALNKEVEENRQIIIERPGLLNRIENLSKLQQESLEKVKELEDNVEKFKLETMKNSNLLSVAEDELKKSQLINQQHQKYKNVMLQKAASIRNEIDWNFLESTKRRIKEQMEQFSDISKSLKQEWMDKVSHIIREKVNQVQISFDEKFKINSNILKDEIKDLQTTIQGHVEEIESLKQVEKKLENRISEQAKNYTEEVDKLSMEKSELNSKILDFQDQVKGLNERIVEKERDFKKLEEVKEEESKRIRMQEIQISEKDQMIKRLHGEVQENKKKSDAVQSLATQAGMGLAAKDEKILILEKTVKSLKQEIEALILEREKTIEAHQSRVKQLQENFLEKLQDAGKEEVEKAVEKIKRIMNAEKDAAIKEWTVQLQEEFDVKEKSLKEQNLAMQRKFEEHKRQMTIKEEDWKKKYDTLIEQNKKVQESNTADFEHYQTRIRSLEAEIIKNQAAPAADGPSASLVEVSELKSIIEKRNAEIVFLKDTVRLECEERIALIAKLAVLTKNGSEPGPANISKAISSPVSLTAIASNTQNTKSDSRDSVTSANGRKSIETMMREAALKKEKKLAKSSSRKKLYGL